MSEDETADIPESDLVNYVYIDLVKAAQAEYASYMFPLMRAVNDVLRFGRYVKSLFSDNASSDLLFPMLRMRQAQNHELLNAFVLAIAPRNQGSEKSIYKFIRSKPRILPLFDNLVELASSLEGDQKGIRDKLVAHYDVMDGHSKLVLKSLVDYVKEDPSVLQSPHIRDAALESRYFCGDVFEDISWRLFVGGFDSQTYKANRPDRVTNDVEFFQNVIGALMEVAGTFAEFGKVTLFEWIIAYELQTGFKTGSIQDERNSQRFPLLDD